MFGYVWVGEPKYKIAFDKEFFARPDTIRTFIESLGDEERPTEEMNVNIIDGRRIAVLQDTLGSTFGTDIIERRYSRITKELRLVVSPSVPPPLATKIPGNGTVLSEAEPEPERIVVQVFNRWNQVKSGRAELKRGKKKQLKILDHSPWEVWPHLPPQSKGQSRGAERPGYDPKRSFTIEVQDGSEQPLSNELVEIKTEFVPLTGGHEHNSPAPPQNKQGTFYGQGKSGNPLIGLVTDAEGKVEVDSLIASREDSL